MALFHDLDWRERMTVRFDINGMMAAVAGDGGIKEETANSLIPRLQQIQNDLQSRRHAGTLPLA